VGRPLPCDAGSSGVGLGFLYTRLPTSFLPDEDQGQLMMSYTLPVGSTMEQTQAVAAQRRT
jgi:multidrug efflux pump